MLPVLVLSFLLCFVSGALHFGMFGMWGTYVFAVLILYSPVGQPNVPNGESSCSSFIMNPVKINGT